MKKVIASLHVSLDGFAAGPLGEMDWIKLDAELFDFVGRLTDEADVALYGRVTHAMMESYWPTAGDQPKASTHDKQHSRWFNTVDKVVLSRTAHRSAGPKTRFIAEPEAVRSLKQGPGKDILIFGSPSLVRELTALHLIDEYRLFVNPVVLGQGLPVFPTPGKRVPLKLMDARTFPCGVVGMHHVLQR